ncbi:MAG: hypothetical protein BGO09_04390 [Bacteroidetes bacterium 47-18]|nr:MAG: hypothetical protein BGO09_04390 [Bacteroidetes bacterium 47-18]
MFQVILKRKYMKEGYQRVMASPGDFGIEGYTKDGQTFQCYCPEMNEENKKLYERQRNKITTDINKLSINQKELSDILGGTKLKSWVLITPAMGHHDLLSHCNDKRDLVKSWNLPFIDNDSFQVLVHEGDDYALEIGEYFNQTGKKLSISPDAEETSAEKQIEWRDTQIDLVNNALTKNEIRVKSLQRKIDLKHGTNSLTNETIKHYLNGESILRIWQSTQPDNHQRFIELRASVEDELKERCLLTEVEPNLFVDEIKGYINERIKAAFPHLDESTLVRLKNYCISFWIISCPLYFETA